MKNLSRILLRKPLSAAIVLFVAAPLLALPSEPAGTTASFTGRATLSPVAERTATRLLASSDAAASVISTLEWRNIGPAIMGGRISDLAVVEANPAVFYVGTATGGVWKTTNYGTTFETVFDDQPTSSIGDVTVSQQNLNLVWVGSGEPQNRQSSPWGNGVYKSLDGGRTWQQKGLYETRHIARIQINPKDNDIVFVAAVGHLWGPNEERGVFRTTDGGDTWEKVLYINEDTGVIDLTMDPNDPNTLFAAAYQRRRASWGFNGGGPGGGIYRTMDGGDSWEELTEGLPARDKGRIGLDIYRGDPNLVFAIVEAGGGRQGVYRSMDRGDTWERLSTTNNRPMYYSQIRVDPQNPDRIYLGGSNLYASDDGGRTFRADAARGVHLDHHALWIDPNNSNNLILGSDGGVSVSFDRSESWRQLRNLVVAQFYEIGVDMRDPYYVCGGLQDNGSWCGPSNTLSTLGIRNRDWYNIGSGDGFYARIDPNDPTVLIAESQGGNFTLVDLTTGERQRIRPLPREQGQGPEAGDDLDYQWNWDAPVIFSEHDSRIIYAGSNYILKSTDRGMSWEAISPNLTKAIDRDELEIMGVQVRRGETLSGNDGISSYGNITTLSESPTNPQVLYVGTDDGNLQGTRDGGNSWQMLNQDMPGLPENTYASRVVASRFREGTVYATFDGHDRDDYRPYVYRSDNHGGDWEAIVDGLPDDWSVNVIYEHPRSPNLLFAGNEVGVFFSIDRGETWAQLENNLPTVPVDDIVVHPRENDLVIGTHGRGIWILDDITPLEHLSDEVLDSDAHLFPVRRAVVFSIYTPQEWSPGIWRAPNPPSGAMIRYYLREDAPLPPRPGGGRGTQEPGPGAFGGGGRGGGGGFGGRGGRNQAPPPTPPPTPEPTVKLTILDSDGEFVRDFEGPGKAGVNQATWDFRIQPAFEQTGGGGGRGRGGFRGGGGRLGPRVLPGTYTVRLEAGGRTLDATVEVVGDPRSDVSRDVLVARQAALMDAYYLAKPMNDAQQALQRLNQQLADIRGLAGEESPDALRDMLRDLSGQTRELLQDLQRARGGLGAANAIQSWTGPPTEDQLWQIEQAWAEAPGLSERINEVIAQMPGLFAMVYQPGFGPEPGEPLEVPQRPAR